MNNNAIDPQVKFIHEELMRNVPLGTEQGREEHLLNMIERGDIGDIRCVMDSTQWDLNQDKHVFAQEGWAEEQGPQQIDYAPSFTIQQASQNYSLNKDEEVIALSELRGVQYLQRAADVALASQMEAVIAKLLQAKALEENGELVAADELSLSAFREEEDLYSNYYRQRDEEERASGAMEWLPHEDQIQINAILDELQMARFNFRAMGAAFDEITERLNHPPPNNMPPLYRRP